MRHRKTTQPQALRRRVLRTRRNRRVRRVPRILWLLALLIGAVTYYGLTNPRFNVSRITVVGTRVLTADQVVRNSGLRTGVNLFRAPLPAATRKLRKLPAVAEVSLHRRLPSRIVIRVQERQPLACVQAKNAYFTVDGVGVAFRLDRTPPRDLPLVGGMEQQTLHLGSRIPAACARAMRACLAAATAAPGHAIKRIHIDQNANLCFNTGDPGYEVRLGSSDQLGEKFALLTALEKHLPDIRRDCKYIDLSCPDAPAWKPMRQNSADPERQGLSRQIGSTEEIPHGSGGFTQD